MIFISYSSKDAVRANRIVDYLESKGIRCWIAPRDILAGSSYPSQIVRAIRDCDGFVLVSSANVNQSNHINSELAQAFDMKKTIYPFMVDNITFSDDYLYFLKRIQWINAYNLFEDGLKELLQAIENRSQGVSAPVRAPIPDPSPRFDGAASSVPSKTGDGIRIATYEDLVSLGMTALDISKRLVENDLKLYPGMVVENEGSPEQWASYLSTYPETFRYLINEKNEIIGNWSFLAISEELHAKKLAAGELLEDTFNLDETEFLLFPGDYVGYLLNLSVNIGYNNTKNLNMLIQAFVEQMLKFANDGIFFKEWFVNVFRKDHEAMYRRIGFTYLVDNTSFGKVYHLNCIPPARNPQKKTSSANTIFLMSKELMELYYDHFMQDS